MAISPEMQARLEKIDGLIKEGYTLEKQWGYFPCLKNSHGKAINIFGGFFELSGPAGFSWIAFFFPGAVCAQIKEWSFFYSLCIFSLFTSVLSLVFNSNADTYSILLFSFFYASMYPYLRYIADKNGVEENPKLISILLGILYSALAIIPAVILETIFI